MIRRLLPLVLVVAACGGGEADKPAPSPSPATPHPILQKMEMKAEPEDAVSVVEAKAEDDGTEVVVVGRINNMVKGLALFNLMDESLDYCGSGADPMEDCPTPWDYCCIAKPVQAEHNMTVEVRDEAGRTVAADPPDLRLLDLVVVKGKIEADEHGNVTVVASGWFRKERPDLREGLRWPQ